MAHCWQKFHKLLFNIEHYEVLPVVGKEKYGNVTAELMLLNYKCLSERKIRKGEGKSFY